MQSVFGPLQALRERALPLYDVLYEARRGYRSYPLDSNHAHAQEKLIEIRDHGLSGVNLYHSNRYAPYYAKANGSIPDLLLRETVVWKLQKVNARLAQAGLELFIMDGWRPTAVQDYFYNTWMPNELRRHDPSLQGEALLAAVSDYWAAPTTDPNSPAPHMTGGAADLTIRWRDSGEHLWMGSLLDDASAVSHVTHFETKRTEGPTFSDDEARANRRLLYWLMSEEGFVNNATEWWHFGYGDQMWAKMANAPAAFYGVASGVKDQ